MNVLKTAPVFALALIGCVPMPLASLTQIDVTESDVAPITRLGRWDGANFVPVEEGSVEATRVHVIVHGWAPGWHRDGSPPSEPAWAAELDGRPFDPWMRELASNLGERDPYAAIFIYSWIDDSATSTNPLGQRRAYARTTQHGRKMAMAIENALSPQFREHGGEIHLVGHSFGARVASIAATELEAPPRHLTILDAPDTGMVSIMNTRADIARQLYQLPVGTGPNDTFVDNYISWAGKSYRFEQGLGAVVDVQTTPPNGELDMSGRHVWAATFYARTVGSSIGAGWSPMLGVAPPRGCFTRPYDRIDLVPRCTL